MNGEYIPTLLDDGPRSAAAALLLAHGSGAAMDSSFMEDMTALLADRGIRVMRFEFAYMDARRHGGSRRPPPRAERLLDEYRAAVDQAADLAAGSALFVGGKSLGGRVASLVAHDLHAAGTVAGLVCLGYPFHPVGKPEKLRTAHLAEIAVPTIICQGERDPFGTREDVAGYVLSAAIRLHWAPDGDHGLSPRRKSGHTPEGNMREAADAIRDFVTEQ